MNVIKLQIIDVDHFQIKLLFAIHCGFRFIKSLTFIF